MLHFILAKNIRTLVSLLVFYPLVPCQGFIDEQEGGHSKDLAAKLVAAHEDAAKLRARLDDAERRLAVRNRARGSHSALPLLDCCHILCLDDAAAKAQEACLSSRA